MESETQRGLSRLSECGRDSGGEASLSSRAQTTYCGPSSSSMIFSFFRLWWDRGEVMHTFPQEPVSPLHCRVNCIYFVPHVADQWRCHRSWLRRKLVFSFLFFEVLPRCSSLLISTVARAPFCPATWSHAWHIGIVAKKRSSAVLSNMLM